MKISELIEKLKEYDEDLEVASYHDASRDGPEFLHYIEIEGIKTDRIYNLKKNYQEMITYLRIR